VDDDDDDAAAPTGEEKADGADAYESDTDSDSE